MEQEIKHTPLPYKAFYTNNKLRLLGIGQDTGEGITDSGFGLWEEEKQAKANADFIVRACNSHYENQRKANAYDNLLYAIKQAPSYNKKRIVNDRLALDYNQWFLGTLMPAIAKAEGSQKLKTLNEETKEILQQIKEGK